MQENLPNSYSAVFRSNRHTEADWQEEMCEDCSTCDVGLTDDVILDMLM